MPKPIKACANPDCSRRVYHPTRDYCSSCWPKFTEEGRAYNAERQRKHAAKTKAHFLAVAAMKAAPLLLICAGAGWADVLPEGVGVAGSRPVQADPLDPLGYRPAKLPRIHGGHSSGSLFDPPVTGRGRIAGPALLASWRGAPAGWNPPGIYGPGRGGGWSGGGGGHGGGHGGGGRPQNHDPPNEPAVPGPAGVLGLGVALGWAQRIRRRVGK